jgi:hypothetical protein
VILNYWKIMPDNGFFDAVRYNCNVSDARDNGIYSICTLVLKLRNLYKWENCMEPWQEPDSPVLLDWIAAKEDFWENMHDKPFMPLPVRSKTVDPFQLPEINAHLSSDGLVYGAGYGRSMKAVFFIAQILEDRVLEGCPVLILGKEEARELSSPFAMLQDGTIIIRKEPLRFFFWDQIQEINPSCRIAMQQALARYDLISAGGSLNREKLIDIFDAIVEQEIDIFVYHEIGESQKNQLDSETLKKIVGAFPATPLELLARAVKDILADTHAKGLLSHIIAREKKSSLGFYISFLDGMRKLLCPEISEASKSFWKNGDWSLVERARKESRKKNEKVAAKLQNLCSRIDGGQPSAELKSWADINILAPLGLHMPAGEKES